ncbi:hypothetical protein [Mesorhizobium amorphae]|uniref:hypothetical protein n=1 Tax=Mesorhizobium amorphae TaxID=71433 RepID=UPI00177B4AAE|nr:hypothetical protein [Mesorhizobium amorphae]
MTKLGLQRTPNLPPTGFLKPGEKADGSHLDAVDREALERSIEIACQDKRAGRAEQIAWKIANNDGGWFEAAIFASFCCQVDSLRLKPWESPPVHGRKEDPQSWRLLRRMLKAGISQFEPDPAAALMRAKR